MAAKIVEIADIGKVYLYKRRGVRSVRMSVTHDGKIRVSLPTWAPYRLGIEFVKSKTDWLTDKQIKRRKIENGDRIGKAHRLVVIEKQTSHNYASRLVGTDVLLTVPIGFHQDSDDFQIAAEKAAIKALKKESQQLLPQRLETLANKYGFQYQSVQIKLLKSRWGSCNEKRDIVLNCFLMQLPWHLIDYVILHELTHTRILRHGEPFWSELSKHVKNLKEVRKEMKSHQPILVTKPGTINTESRYAPIKLNVTSV